MIATMRLLSWFGAFTRPGYSKLGGAGCSRSAGSFYVKGEPQAELQLEEKVSSSIKILQVSLHSQQTRFQFNICQVKASQSGDCIG